MTARPLVMLPPSTKLNHTFLENKTGVSYFFIIHCFFPKLFVLLTVWWLVVRPADLVLVVVPLQPVRGKPKRTAKFGTILPIWFILDAIHYVPPGF